MSTSRSRARAALRVALVSLVGLLAIGSLTGLVASPATAAAIEWTQRTPGANNGWSAVAYGDGQFVAVSRSGTDRVMTSPDGTSWTTRNGAAANDWTAVAFGGGLFVAVAQSGVGDRVMTSPDGITWTSRASVADKSWISVTYGNGMFVAVSNSNEFMTSTDGITWTSRIVPVYNFWSSVAYGSGKFVAVSYSGTSNRVMTSPDGITWTSRASAADNAWRSVSYGAGKFVAVASHGSADRVMTSADGITWTSNTPASQDAWYSVVYGAQLWVSVASGAVMTSGPVTLSVTTTAATAITGTTATLSGAVNSNAVGETTSDISVRYSADQSVVDSGGGQIAPVTPTTVTGNTATTVSADVTELSPGTQYYFRLTATNVRGRVDGSVDSFTTVAAPTPTPTPTPAPTRTPTPAPTSVAPTAAAPTSSGAAASPSRRPPVIPTGSLAPTISARPTPIPTSTVEPAPALSVTLSAALGSPVIGSEITIVGGGLAPGANATVTAHSDPVLVGSLPADSAGRISGTLTMPVSLPSGGHRLVVAAPSASGAITEATTFFGVSATGTVSGIGPDAATAADRDATQRRNEADSTAEASARQSTADPSSDLPLYSPLAEPEQVLTLGVAAFALLGLVTGGGLLRTDGDDGGEAGNATDQDEPQQPGGASDSLTAQPSDGWTESADPSDSALTAGDGSAAVDRSDVGASVSMAGASAVAVVATAVATNAATGDASRKKAKVTSAKTKLHKLKTEGEGAGDQSWTWRWPMVAWLDRVSMAWPLAIAPKSPLAGRLLVDGSYLRAMFGTLTLLLPVLAGVLAAFAVEVNDGSPLPPTLPFMIALLVIGVLDALAGAVAAVVYSIGVVLAGGVTNADSVRILMGIGVLWFVVPLIANASRPLRRPFARGPEFWFDRIADFVLAALIGGWAAQKMIGAWPGLAGLQLPVVDISGSVALIVLVLLVLRMVLESMASLWYPSRVAALAPVKLPYSGKMQRILSLFLRTAIFVFVAAVYIGFHWQLWAGAVLFFVPQLMSIYDSHFPNFPKATKFVPTGLFKLVLMMVVGLIAVKVLLMVFTEPEDMLLWGFVLLSIPGIVLGVFDLLARDGPALEISWRLRIIGCFIFAAGVALATMG